MELRAAEALVNSLGVSHPRDIDLEAIAFDQGAIVKYRHLSSCEARIVGSGDRAVITVDNTKYPTRVRFSLAHELGHWHFHRGRSLVCREEDIGNQRRSALDPERVADSYAADLLMPRYLFCPLAESLGRITFENIEKLASEFSTSITATAIRVVEYGHEPAMLICHGRQGRKWFNRPKHIPERWFPKQELDADSFALDVLFGSERKSRRAIMDASAWFDRNEANRYTIFEQSMKISEEEILTVLVLNDAEMLEDKVFAK